MEDVMFNLLQSATDDQTALGACVLTLFGATMLVFASFHLGPAGQKLKKREKSTSELKMIPRISVETERSHDRAA
jgi:hypothetical protein